MPHMVVFRSGEGKPGYHQVDGLDDAVRFVERLRNQEGIADCRVFRMEEVPLEFKTYVKVEVAVPSVGDPAVAPAAAPAGRPSAGAKVPASTPSSAASTPVEDAALLDDPVVVDPLVGNAQGGSRVNPQAAGRFNRFNRS